MKLRFIKQSAAVILAHALAFATTLWPSLPAFGSEEAVG
jgi:hypothetical protein